MGAAASVAEALPAHVLPLKVLWTLLENQLKGTFQCGGDGVSFPESKISSSALASDL